MTRTTWAGLSNRRRTDRRICRQAGRQEDWRQHGEVGGHSASYKVNKLTFYFPAQVKTRNHLQSTLSIIKWSFFKNMNFKRFIYLDLIVDSAGHVLKNIICTGWKEEESKRWRWANTVKLNSKIFRFNILLLFCLLADSLCSVGSERGSVIFGGQVSLCMCWGLLWGSQCDPAVFSLPVLHVTHNSHLVRSCFNKMLLFLQHCLNGRTIDWLTRVSHGPVNNAAGSEDPTGFNDLLETCQPCIWWHF